LNLKGKIMMCGENVKGVYSKISSENGAYQFGLLKSFIFRVLKGLLSE